MREKIPVLAKNIDDAIDCEGVPKIGSMLICRGVRAVANPNKDGLFDVFVEYEDMVDAPLKLRLCNRSGGTNNGRLVWPPLFWGLT